MLAMTSLQETANKTGWVWYLLVVLVVLGAIIWWMYSQTKKQQKEQQQQKEQPPTEQEKPKKQMVSEISKESDDESGKKDDLTKIEGIGPKVAKVLSDAGITNFEALSNADPSEVKTVLNEAGLQMMSPDGWIEQAELAANDDWDGLQKLQDELKGGRRR